MSELQLTARFEIHPGALDRFKALAQSCLESVREKDSGTLQYDWFFNKEQTVCVARERYANSSAFLEHAGNLGNLLPALFEVSDFSAEVCGTPSDEVVKAIEGLDITYYRHFQSP